MKKLLSLLTLFITINAFSQTIGNTNVGTTFDTLWYNGAWINAVRYQAPTNMTITNALAYITATTGRYKLAVYAGSATVPNNLLRGSYEVVNPATTKWYSFPFTNSLTLTNNVYYWFAIWSDSSAANISYTAGTNPVNWGQYNYGEWPNPLNITGGSPQDYCIYATNVISGGTTNPAVSYRKVTIQWDPSPDLTVTGYNFYYGVGSRTYTNTINNGISCQITVSNLVVNTTYYFAATAYNALGTESVFSDELVYTIPRLKGATLRLQSIGSP